jgi:hypothetical protein
MFQFIEGHFECSATGITVMYDVCGYIIIWYVPRTFCSPLASAAIGKQHPTDRHRHSIMDW